ncbi:MAG TPA: hypothetical protein DDZ80_12950 [Cyanobacteria bacterium UBA8803]|nr:hypothetical protein [Cyanobacteria bacterium UBA9273]HBL59382.1 hypothetical protein [Cyanobacteria bacterium UBA8803]
MSDRKRLNLDAYIKIEQERISRSRVLLHGIRFTLDKEILQRIKQAKQMGYRLDISRPLLTDLRYVSLIDSENRLQSGLAFCTYYCRGESEEALMRSVISLDGDIVNQIRSDCLERPNFCRELASAHYWLIEQLLTQLRLGALVRLNLLLSLLCWGLALLIVGAMVILALPDFLNNPWMFLVALVMVCLLEAGLQRLLRLFLPTIRRWVWRRLLLGLLSHKPRSKQITKRLLAWLVP